MEPINKQQPIYRVSSTWHRNYGDPDPKIIWKVERKLHPSCGLCFSSTPKDNSNRKINAWMDGILSKSSPSFHSIVGFYSRAFFQTCFSPSSTLSLSFSDVGRKTVSFFRCFPQLIMRTWTNQNGHNLLRLCFVLCSLQEKKLSEKKKSEQKKKEKKENCENYQLNWKWKFIGSKLPPWTKQF